MAKQDFLGSDVKVYLDDTSGNVISEVDIEVPNVDINSTLQVDVINISGDINSTGDIDISGDINSTGSIDIEGNLQVDGSITANGNLQVNQISSGAITSTGSITGTSFSGNGANLTSLSASALPLSVSTSSASGGGSLSYNSGSGVFTFRPATFDTSISTSESSASGNGSISWSSSTRTLTYRPPTLAGLGYSEPEPLTSLNAIGTYAFLRSLSPYEIAPGNTMDGSLLRYAGIAVRSAGSVTTSVYYTSSVPTGTWRAMGYSRRQTITGRSGDEIYGITLWVRIS